MLQILLPPIPVLGKFESDAYWDRYWLPYKAVRLTLLNEPRDAVGHASGFLLRRQHEYSLYTCWHVVTGFDMHDIRVGMELPKRRHLRIERGHATYTTPGQMSVTAAAIELPLYETSGSFKEYRWIQEVDEIPHRELNQIGLKVPKHYDLVKISLDASLPSAAGWDILEENVFRNRLFEFFVDDNGKQQALAQPDFVFGDRLAIAGYPYGFRVKEQATPRAVVLSRIVAATEIDGRENIILTDGGAAPAMSGGPVFFEHNSFHYLVGIYVGQIFPDYRLHTRNPNTALGQVCDIRKVVCAFPFRSDPAAGQ